VAEGDEYDTAFFDKGPKFLHYLPQVAVLGNVEFDHADIYRDGDEVERAFRLFANLVPRNGLLIAGIESERARRVAEGAISPLETFAAEGEADWTAEVLDSGASGTRFRLLRRGVAFAEASARLWGPASLRNALAAAVRLLGCSGRSSLAGSRRSKASRALSRCGAWSGK
jgi:UDP-N-acetylmuramate: L-alanyl-gamma-D-glutamyl-meso-diaminopimelate ligase